MSNPLLSDFDLPPWSAIKPCHVEPAIDSILAENRKNIDELLQNQPHPPTWQSLVQPLEALDAKLSRAFGPVSHLNAVCNNQELRTAYENCLPKISAYSTELGQNKRLFAAYQALSQDKTLNLAQQTIVKNSLRDFRLSGIDLPQESQQRFAQIQQELAELTSRFSNQLLDATEHWHQLITDEAELCGVPELAKAQMQQAAERKNQQGWRVSLEYPCYHVVMTYADNRALRETVYRAHATRASDQGPNAGQFDNGPLMQQILRLREEEAKLLGFAHYAELSLQSKMAESPQQVIGFLQDLAERSRAFALNDLAELKAFAEASGQSDLQSWDISYFSEKLQQRRFSLSQEALRAYFPIDKVLSGLFAIVHKLYGIEVTELQHFERWHQDVRLFAIVEKGEPIGRFYLDLYAREGKRGGAWMDNARDRRRDKNGALIRPDAYLVCNFSPPTTGKPALLTHDDVITLFHEFGHGLHHLLSEVDQLDASGINGVAWDAVELPSQFMENWCWQSEALSLISSHYQTGEPLPTELLSSMLAARNFQSALMMLRQLEFSLFDLELHQNQDGKSVQQVLGEVRKRIAVLIPPSWNRFANSFSHIFAGGYAAGYYSYKWAEVLSADAFARFEEDGLFNAETGRAFRSAILASGGSEEAMDLFVRFRGRKPSIDALLRHSGLTDD